MHKSGFVLILNHLRRLVVLIDDPVFLSRCDYVHQPVEIYNMNNLNAKAMREFDYRG